MNQSVEERARLIAEPLLTEAGFALWDVIFEKEGAMNYLRIHFTKDGESPDDDEVTAMTAPLNSLMDAQDFIRHVDILEVGSPGLTRRLRRHSHFTASLEKQIRVLKRGDKGKLNVFYGLLSAYDDEKKEITLTADAGIVVLNIKNCQRINLDLDL